MNVAILGTGFGQYHLKMYHELGVHVVSIFGRNEDVLEKIKASYDVETTHVLESVLEDERVDVVDICLPSFLHYEWIIRSLKAGKHVYCETPVTYSLNECQEILKVSEETGKFVYVDLFFKFSFPHRQSIRMTKDKKYGQLKSIKSYNKTAALWGDLSLERSLLNFHIHHYDFLQELVTGEFQVKTVGKEIREKASEWHVMLDFEEGVLAHMESHSGLPEHAPFMVGFELIYEKAILKYDGAFGKYSEERFYKIDSTGEKEIIEIQPVNDHQEVIKHMMDCVKKGEKSPWIDISHAMTSLMYIERIKETL